MQAPESIIISPFNYTGGKHKLLGQLLPLFPDDVKTFVDLFSGGGCVGLNARAENVIMNDVDADVISLCKLFKKYDGGEICEHIFAIIERYGLSRSDLHPYAYYGCDSRSGLMPYNKEKFMRLRSDFNVLSRKDDEYYFMMYALMVHAFNNQIRFNSRGEYNIPAGKRDFNAGMQEKARRFADRLKEISVEFGCRSFEEVDAAAFGEGTFVYCDPPYLITCATYNERGGWNEERERQLLAYLDELDRGGCRFALSNVLSSKGRVNEILSRWIESRAGRYGVHRLNYSYSNSNYHSKGRNEACDEVLITNY